MKARRHPRILLLAVFLLITVLVSGGVWRFGYFQALEQASQKGTVDLALAADRLEIELAHVRELSVLLSDHPTLKDRLNDRAEDEAASRLLLKALDKTALLDVHLLDETGFIISSALGSQQGSFAQQPFVKRAMNGALGFGHGVHSGLAKRAFYFAAPIFSEHGPVEGVIILIMDVERFESSWRGSRPAILFTDSSGLVFISNRSELIYLNTDTSAETSAFPVQAKADVNGHQIWDIDAGSYVPAKALHLEKYMPIAALRAHALIDIAPVVSLAAWQTAFAATLMLSFAILLFFALERRRTLSLANQELETRVAARTEELSYTNDQLRNEIFERKEAEQALKQAQEELVQAGKLSALGQMSAGISHELNQPLMAIQSFAENGEMLIERGRTEGAEENFRRISEMARRMGRIIKNLRAFAKQEVEPAKKTDVTSVITEAVAMSEGKIERGQITLDWVPPNDLVWVLGGEVRLQQVLVNLISNAADSITAAGSDRRHISVRVAQGNKVTVTVRDTGPGIDEPEKIFDPFYSTKAVGSAEGMGLGLSISYGLVQSFGGAITGQNAPDGGAVFSIELQPWSGKDEAS